MPYSYVRTGQGLLYCEIRPALRVLRVCINPNWHLWKRSICDALICMSQSPYTWLKTSTEVSKYLVTVCQLLQRTRCEAHISGIQDWWRRSRRPHIPEEGSQQRHRLVGHPSPKCDIWRWWRNFRHDDLTAIPIRYIDEWGAGVTFNKSYYNYFEQIQEIQHDELSCAYIGYQKVHKQGQVLYN